MEFIRETATHKIYDGTLVNLKKRFTKADYENGFIKAFYYYKVLKSGHRAQSLYYYTRRFLDEKLCVRLESQIRKYHSFEQGNSEEPRVKKSVLRMFQKRHQRLGGVLKNPLDIIDKNDHFQS